ncbi:SDR family oxidoreductase [Lactiplantibacillus mudanjiangensis]|uniref:NAD-dependent dehydratase [Lactobacillus pentosus] n=1 Tax=Lactiplantibacillus mudanjiangensis TaxID=1296538 RepID=A0A660E007_9LACO|nr:SDR family oxidoreductase [Lactiplantibacillus mudanjiangensis]VDG23579.1 NAD-dependent dehydratase [Lactobacillus pentosus] [Lactiplantibacillus mudanjiangensis]VDG28810.1 NAD-dependent dehydratase [Lactobacillus pentosus] [Lactiplantibacillus mudanjiangensis]
MTKVLILGAAGQIARLSEQQFLADTNVDLTLYLRNAQRVNDLKSARVTVIDGDTTDEAKLTQAIAGQDVVYANLAGQNIKTQAETVLAAMHAANVKRLIWISTLGIYDEVPGKFGAWNNATLGSYLTRYYSAAEVLENSDLDYTIIRPAWLTNKPEVAYETTGRHDAFKGTEVSRQSIAALVVKLATHPDEAVRASLGVNKPDTDGDKPAWY